MFFFIVILCIGFASPPPSPHLIMYHCVLSLITHPGERKQSKLFTCKVHQRPEGRYESIFYNDENKRFKSMADVARSLDLIVITVKKRNSSSKYYDSDDSSNDSPPKKRVKKAGREPNDVMVDPLMQSMALSQREEEAMEKLALYLEERGGTRRQTETFTCTAKQRPCGRYESIFSNTDNKRFKSMADVARSLDLSTVPLSGIFGGGGGGGGAMTTMKTSAKSAVIVQTVKVRVKMNDSSSEGDEEEEEAAPLYAKLDTIVVPATNRNKGETSAVKNEEDEDDAKISARHTNLLDSIGKFSHGRPVPLNPRGLLNGEPKKPKNAPNSFALFCADAKNTMPEVLDGMGGPGKMQDRTRVIAAKWNSMDEASKQKYKDLAVLAKEKQNKLMDQYKIDMEEFKRLNPGVLTSADLAKDAKAAVKEALTSALDFPPSATPEEVISIKGQSKGKYCAFEDCTRYRQSGCYGYCLTHRHLADPEAHALLREKANEEVNMKKRFLTNKSNLCKWPECIRYIQSNCHGYCLTHVKYADYMGEGERGDGDGEDWLNNEGEDLLYEVTKVRVRLDSKLQQGFCKAILPQELRDEWGFNRYEDGEGYNLDGITGDDVTDHAKSVGKKPVCLEVKESESSVNSDEKKDDDEEPVSADTASDDAILDDTEVPKPSKIKYSDDLLDFAVSATCQKKANGANKCRAISCDKNYQGNSDGFCRQHYNQYLINTGQCNSWDCICGGQVPDIMARCGTCHRWRDGKHRLELSSSPGLKRAKNEVAEENTVEVDDNVEPWKCDCGNMIPSGKSRCGQCHHWKGGKRQGGWKLGSMGRDYDSDEDVDRTQDWECCGVIISAQKTRCGKCNGWRNGKRIAAAAQSQEPWLCAKCHISNPASRRRCGGCLTWKAAPSHTAAVAVMQSLNGPNKQPKAKASVGFVGKMGDESGDQWKCTKCNFGNFSTQLECSNCDEFRPNYQWHKKQQDIQSVTAAPAPTPQPSQPAISVVTQAATSTAIQPPISGPPDDLNYYGTFDEELGYPEISIHYDFNRAYYHNNNYSYLNKSVVRSSNRKDI